MESVHFGGLHMQSVPRGSGQISVGCYSNEQNVTHSWRWRN